MQLDRCCDHNANSHDDDQSKYLKHEQIVAVADAVTVAPQLSAAQFRRNTDLFLELQVAFILSCSIRICIKQDSYFCERLGELRKNECVIKFMVSDT
jgi:hypothetical protein